MQKQPRCSEPEKIINADDIASCLGSFPKTKLWTGATFQVPLLPLTAELAKGLSFARRCGQLRGGLENIEIILQREEVGLQLTANAKNCVPHISRLLVIGNDGSERFYRHCEMLLRRYENRLYGIKVDSSGSVLGSKFFGKDTMVKVALVSRRDCLERIVAGLSEKS